ncbi:hypothetical protein SARC_08358, partial [Sphaeroforma arctica JP610]
FVQGKLFRVPDADHGIFFSGECCIFLCIYWKEEELNNAKYEQDSESEDEEAEDEFEAILYFWTGRDAPSNLWPRFTLQHAPQLMDLVKKKYQCDLEIRRMFQQRETERFLSHFRRKSIIYRGPYSPGCEYSRARLFQMRQMSSIITQRTVEVPLSASVLDSTYCFILVAPHEKRPGGVVYVWIGRQTRDADAQTAMTMSTIISRAYDNAENATSRYVIRVAPENGEHPSFLRLLSYNGRSMTKDTDVPALVRYSAGSMRCLLPAPGVLPDYDLKRLFRCSNRTGSFVVSEISQDFCQDDLDHNDCFLLGSRRRVYLWVGKDTSDVVQKLALKSAQTFVADQGDGYPRDGVEKVFAGEESLVFQRFFHGWWPEA